MRLPPIRLRATDGRDLPLGDADGHTLIFCYPHIGQPGAASPAPDWDLIPGARGCTTEACGFRDWHAEFTEMDLHVLGVSTDDPAYQQGSAERLGLPFPLLSDARLELAKAWRLPVFEAEGRVFLRRLSMLVCDGVVQRVWYPIFPPDRHAAEVLDALRQ